MTRLRPSNANFWMNCPGWLKHMQEADLLIGENAAANEGIAAHETAAAYLQGKEIEADEELKEAVELYKKTIVDATGEITPENIENKIVIDEGLGIKGTPDYWHFDPETGTLSVFDFKYGRKYVSAIENYQLILYALGLLRDQEVCASKFQLYIIQPRNYHPSGPVRKWSIIGTALADRIDKIITAAWLTAMEGGDLSAGEHCLYCEGRHTCPALSNAAGEACEYLSQPVYAKSDPVRLGRELTMLQAFSEMMKAKRTGLEAQITALISSGTPIPGYRMEPGRGRMAWSLPPEQVVALGNTAGIDLANPSVITPRQAEQKGLDSAAVLAVTERPKTGLKLVQDNGQKAQEVFE